ncbi:MAG: hypothetical protein WC509_03525 [Candidatus Izemoplasmatales bacterium]
MKRFLLITTFLLCLATVSTVRVSALEAAYGAAADMTDDAVLEIPSFRDETYYRTVRAWLSEYDAPAFAETRWTAEDAVADNPGVTFVPDDGFGGQVASLAAGETVAVTVTVPAEGLYELALDFAMTDAFYTIPTVALAVNGSSPYSEADSLELDVAWTVVPLSEDVRYNRYGNELLPDAEGVLGWSTYWIDDAAGLSAGPCLFLLVEGDNEIAVTAGNLPVRIGGIRIRGRSAAVSYADYRAAAAALPDESDGAMITIEGEGFALKNDLEIKPSYYKESAMTPYAYMTTVLNQLDGGSMARGGTKVTYRFTVDKPGFYALGLKAYKRDNAGVAAVKTIYLDGAVPFREFSMVAFDTTRRWENVVLGGDDPYELYLTAGEHTLTLESTASAYADAIDRLTAIMDSISAISLTVQTITGGNPDDAVDWNILKYIPDLEATLLSQADELEALYDELDAFDAMRSAPEISTLNVAAKQLRRVARTPNKIGSKLAQFSEGSGSAYQLVGAAVAALLSQPLSVDRLYLFDGADLPKPTGSFFTRLWHGILSFVYSFFDARYNDTGAPEGTLEVWVGQSTLYLDIIQSMIDTQFSADTGIEVKCSVLASGSKIVLSNATNDNPDVVLSIDDWTPYSYALRGMIEDLSTYPGFDETAAAYVRNNFTPMIFEDGVYGIPETQSVFLLYYRADILDYLDLEVPDTWQDVLDILPILQSHRMNFFHPLGGADAFKGYGYTTPIIYQMGGEIFTEDGIETTLKDPTTVEAIRFMTDLFTIYDMPLQVSSFFEHFRSGDMPIGIAGADMYLSLKYAAPELSGQWGVTVMPGMDADGDGSVERYGTTYGKASILFSNSPMKDEGWELIRWWNSTATQIDFMQKIKTGLGEKFLQMSANMPALEASVWDEDVKGPMIRQAQWSRIPAITPGSYVVERELSSIWNKIVIDLENVSVAINASIPRITRELNRKFEEFGYRTSTNPDGREYLVAMESNIARWIEGGYLGDER